MSDVDVLMITYERPEYVRRSLARLLETADDRTRVWLWHNGPHEETRAVVAEHADHPRVHRVHVSEENVGLREPTNWVWREGHGSYVSKVDDDCLVSPGWIETFRRAHEDVPELGVVASWRFYDEDFEPVPAARKTVELAGGHRLLRNHWVQGSGYLAKRSLVERVGPLRDGMSFTRWCIRAAQTGAVNGWYLPFVHEEHMDDPRSPYTVYTDDEALRARLPLSARTTGVRTVEAWTDQMRRSAHIAQTASLDLREYTGVRFRGRQAVKRVRRLTTGRAPW